MNFTPLNASPRFNVWKTFSPGEWIDFNPTVITVEKDLRLGIFRRDRVPPIPGEGSIWIVPLDKELHPIGSPAPLIARGEDPRAVFLGNRLFVFFVVIEKGVNSEILGSSMMFEEFDLSVYPPLSKSSFRLPLNPTGKAELADVRWEKNWVPFIAGNNLIALIYSHQPWTVLLLDVSCPTPVFINSLSSPGLSWPYGEIRGGTPPVKWNEDQMITFFHSSQIVGSRNVYMTGACVFDNTPPFTPRQMTNEPLIIAPYRSTMQRFGWPVLGSVVFPLGLISDCNIFHLLCGIDDGEIGVISINRSEIIERLDSILPSSFHSLVDSNTKFSSLPIGPVIFTTDVKRIQGQIPIVRYLKLRPKSTGIFLDIGAEEGLYSVYLSDCHSRVITIEKDNFDYIQRNLSANLVSNALILTEDKLAHLSLLITEEIALIRINQRDTMHVISLLYELIEKCKPLILIHNFDHSNESTRVAETLFSLGYDVESLFPLQPDTLICSKEAHRKLYPWLL